MRVILLSEGEIYKTKNYRGIKDKINYVKLKLAAVFYIKLFGYSLVGRGMSQRNFIMKEDSSNAKS